MEERKFVAMSKEELGVKNYIKKEFGKGKVSSVKIEYTPVGEKIIISTPKPGVIIGRKGESIENLTAILKKRFKMENPHIEVQEIKVKELDAQLVADDIASSIERFGSIRFKAIAYKALEDMKKAGALGGEVVLSGRLPSERAKTWRFKFGYLKKTGNQRKLVDKAQTAAQDNAGVVGVEVSILKPIEEAKEGIVVNEELITKLKENKKEKEENSAENIKLKPKKNKNKEERR
ncbi:MAG: 30S ribosomal protein S3 [Candidatus Pacearchaeota archaeon]